MVAKSLSDLDYRFLAASEVLDRQDVELRLEAERVKELQTRLGEEQKRRVQEQKTVRLQRFLLAVVSGALLITAGLGIFAFFQYRRATLSEIKALASSSEGQFDSNHRLDALVDAIRAKWELQSLGIADHAIAQSVDTALQRSVLGSDELNRLVGHRGGVLGIAFSPNGQWIVTTSNDRTAKIWRSDGTLLHTLKHDATTFRVAISPNGQFLAITSLDGHIHLWRVTGTQQVLPLKDWAAHKGPAWDIAFSPNGQTIASVGGDNTVKLWQADGTLLRTLNGHQASVWSVRVWNLSQILSLNPPTYACDWVRDYLRTNTEVEGSTSLCSNISRNSPMLGGAIALP